MKRKLFFLSSLLVAMVIGLIVACNVLVIRTSAGKCYDDIDDIPHRTYGLLLGSGRSATQSPYYDARLQAAIDLYRAHKIDSVFISGENLYDDYNEMDSMVAAMQEALVPIAYVDYMGTNTRASLCAVRNIIGSDASITIISQHFHNRRAVYYGAHMLDATPVAYNAKDTDIWYWDIWRFCRESLARTKAVLLQYATSLKDRFC